ncbi:CCA tRNA nucleotidyltransferase [Candidatus Bodocaedibacter vickermanii]|uniref:CCA tRNA nucleotidyltransferase n=1 Tax=Candidatus Bodocaedibacter vickermanii TaxID=2741701 RepID=A0A7L9RSF1_9PROT|nr:CCA tRNA nucleotidyltransferase [Candidatus Paracaedibacteraceae bacterium 'Lake Konstanz']
MIPAGRLSSVPWGSHTVLEQFIQKLATNGITARLVGGAVREAILNRFNQDCDIDLAVDITPDEMIAACLELEVQVIPSGLMYGTVTCILNGKPYEVTSLRKDVATDGRKATVRYTKDWHEDATRRDLTINALYADWDGTYYDPTGQGVVDLNNQYLRFIGDPEQRIQEDYLRIVRFFRFMALFDTTQYDEQAFNACLKYASQLHIVSLERKWSELQKIFESVYPFKTIEALISSKLMLHVCRINWSLNKLERSIQWIQNHFNDIFYWFLGGVNHFQIDRNICIPISLQKRLEEIFKVTIQKDINLKDLYLLGRSVYKDVYIRNLITTQDFSADVLQKCNEMLLQIDTLDIPKFPVSGGDLQELGFTPGPLMGEILKKAEQWWVDQDFTPDHKQCLKHIQQLHLTKLRDKI